MTVLALLCLALVNAPPIAAQSNGNGNGNGSGGAGNGNGNGNEKHDDPPVLSATPEAGSVVLFATGTAGLATYALLRVRAARRTEDN
ncbi:MAG TPA: hypothetical protein VGL99_34100 [Chloroflexota bacterium]